MEVRVGSYYEDAATGAQREVHVSLSDADGKEQYGDKWDSWSIEDRSHKLTLLADFFMLQYAQIRGLRNEENVNAEIQSMFNKEALRVAGKS